jgi:ribosomal protein S1
MIDRCRNCGKLCGEEVLKQDWDAVCIHCGQLLWLRAGDVAECRVTKIIQFGIFVELGDGVEGLIHVTELADHPIQHPEEVVRIGSLIRAAVLRVDVSEKKIGLSRRSLVR